MTFSAFTDFCCFNLLTAFMALITISLTDKQHSDGSHYYNLSVDEFNQQKSIPVQHASVLSLPLFPLTQYFKAAVYLGHPSILIFAEREDGFVKDSLLLKKKH